MILSLLWFIFIRIRAQRKFQGSSRLRVHPDDKKRLQRYWELLCPRMSVCPGSKVTARQQAPSPGGENRKLNAAIQGSIGTPWCRTYVGCFSISSPPSLSALLGFDAVWLQTFFGSSGMPIVGVLGFSPFHSDLKVGWQIDFTPKSPQLINYWSFLNWAKRKVSK